MENNHKKEQYEDEIDLRDYIDVLLKRKWQILAIFFVIVIVTAVISLTMPKTFEASALVKTGKIKNTNIENIDNIKAIFSSGATLETIRKKLDFLPPETALEGIKTIFSFEGAGENLLINGRADSPASAVKVVQVITELLVDRHQSLFAQAKKTLDKEIETIENNKQKTEKDIKKITTDIERLDEDIARYENEINTRANIQSEGQGRIAESYINLLAEVKNQKEGKEAQILGIEQELVNIDQQLQQKEFEQTYQTMPTTVEAAAIPPETRIAPNRTQNVMIAGILGLFIGIFYAFASEYFKKVKV